MWGVVHRVLGTGRMVVGAARSLTRACVYSGAFHRAAAAAARRRPKEPCQSQRLNIHVLCGSRCAVPVATPQYTRVVRLTLCGQNRAAE